MAVVHERVWLRLSQGVWRAGRKFLAAIAVTL
jgi:hypothetical protein